MSIKIGFDAPAKFAAWMCKNQHRDPKFGHVYNYHSRSDSHSIALCDLVMQDLLEASRLMREHAAEGKIAYGINVNFTWPVSQKNKTIDLAVGIPSTPSLVMDGKIRKTAQMSDVLISCEAKAVMTEHGKSQPRVYSELNDSHQIVTQGSANAIAAGITVVNIADTFVSPLRNQSATIPLNVTRHRQPAVTASMRNHLLALKQRQELGQQGFDAYSTVLVNCDNQTGCTLHTAPPAPQPGDPDHYDTFVERIAAAYAARFSKL